MGGLLAATNADLLLTADARMTAAQSFEALMTRRVLIDIVLGAFQSGEQSRRTQTHRARCGSLEPFDPQPS
jgi:hypothetical protein